MMEIVIAILAILGIIWGWMLYANRKYDLRKKGFEVMPGIIMWRTTRGLKFIDREAKRHRRFWVGYGTLAAIVGVAAMIFIFSLMVWNLVLMFSLPATAAPGVVLLYPGLVPGLPLLEWLIAISSLLLVHELSHGFLMRAEGIRTKSVGAVLFVAIPGAFVEQDDVQLRKAPILTRLRVYACGSFGNFMLAITCLAILLVVLVPKPGVYTYSVAENYTADNVGIMPGTHIVSLNGTLLDTLQDYEDIRSAATPGDPVRIVTDNATIDTTWAAHPDNENYSLLGVSLITGQNRWNFINPVYIVAVAMAEILPQFDYFSAFHEYVHEAIIPWSIVSILKWMFVINIGVGLFNMLPAVPLDGGYMLQGLLEKVTSKNRAKKISYVVALFALAMIIMSFIPRIIASLG